MRFGTRGGVVKRHGLGLAAVGVLAVLQSGWVQAGAQTTANPSTAGAPVERHPLTASGGLAPTGQTGVAAPAVSFPPTDPRNFTAASPSVETVNSFLHALWGFDENRIWSVAAIQPTQAPGVVAVHVLVAEKAQGSHMAQTTLYITPDGQHAIAGDVIHFGAQPFAETKALLAKSANGPARGAADKQLELVEFTDLQCTACKTAQATLDQLQQQFPQAHIVVEDMPLTRSHPFAYQAATVGYCVRQAKGDAGYFSYAGAVLAAQADLTGEKVNATLGAAAKTAGADPAAMAACAATPAAKAAVDAVIQLGSQAGVNDIPALFVNGRGLPLAQVPVQTLNRIVAFQGQLDGLSVQQQPSLSTLK